MNPVWPSNDSFQGCHGPERIPFGAVTFLFGMGAINKCHASIDDPPMAFFHAETFNMGIVAAQG